MGRKGERENRKRERGRGRVRERGSKRERRLAYLIKTKKSLSKRGKKCEGGKQKKMPHTSTKFFLRNMLLIKDVMMLL